MFSAAFVESDCSLGIVLEHGTLELSFSTCLATPRAEEVGEDDAALTHG